MLLIPACEITSTRRGLTCPTSQGLPHQREGLAATSPTGVPAGNRLGSAFQFSGRVGTVQSGGAEKSHHVPSKESVLR
jgi:hypothetical protein